MKKKTTKRLTVKEKALKKSLGVYHLLVYVEGCSPKLKKFSDVNAMNEFIFKFTQEYPNQKTGDNWIDYAVTDIVGDVLPFDDSINMESA